MQSWEEITHTWTYRERRVVDSPGMWKDANSKRDHKNLQTGPNNAHGLRVTDVRMGRLSQEQEDFGFGGFVLFCLFVLTM